MMCIQSKMKSRDRYKSALVIEERSKDVNLVPF